MTTRTLRLSSTLLLAAALAAQYEGEPPALTSPLAEQPGMRPSTFGLQFFEGMTSRAEPGGSRYFVISGRQSSTSPMRLKAWRLSATLSWTPLTDLDAITRDGDQDVSLSHDRTALAVFRSGVGMELLTRPSTSVPFQTRRTITNLFPLSYAPAFTWVDKVPTLFTCTTSQPASIAMHDLDIATATASNGRRLSYSLAGATHWIGVTPVEDSNGQARGLLFGEGLNATFMDRFGYVPNVGLSRVINWFLDSPKNNRMLAPMQVGGGSFLFPCLGVGNSAFPESVLRADMVMAFDQALERISASIVNSLTPSGTNPFDCALLLGPLAPRPLEIPGITGKLAIDPSLIVALPVQRANKGVVTWTLNLLGAPPNVGVTAQPLAFDSNRWFLGSTSWVHTY